jgi:hypothetical protein
MAMLASLLIAATGRRAAARFETATKDPVAVQHQKLMAILRANSATKRSSRRLKAPLLHVMKDGWHERQDKRAAAEGKPVFQSKDVVLDAKEQFHAEPDDLAAEVALDEAS